MTKKTALSLLACYEGKPEKSPKHFALLRCRRCEQRQIYLGETLKTLMRRISRSQRDPISETQAFYWEMDYIFSSSKSDVSRWFAGTVRSILGDILDYLWIEEEAGQRDMESYIYNVLMEDK